MKTALATLACMLLVITPAPAENAGPIVAFEPVVVTKLVEPFDAPGWLTDTGQTAGGFVALSPDIAPGAEPGSSLKMEAHYGGDGAKWYVAMPPAPIVIPGNARRITLFVRQHGGEQHGLRMIFRDGWGRDKTGDEYLGWDMPLGAADEWKTVTFDVPDKWVRPVTITGFTTGNGKAPNVDAHPDFWVDQLTVTTDLSGVDPATGLLKTWAPDPQADPAKALKEPPAAPLMKLTISTSEKSNIFARVAPAFNVSVMSWKSEDLTGKVSYKVTGLDNVFGGFALVAAEGSTPITVKGATSVTVPLAIEKFGVYTLDVSVELSDGTKQAQQMQFARIPADRELTDEQKLASPYGVNVHGGGGDKVPVDQFKKAGLVWFRDYAWQLEWVTRAKGEDKKYTGWPDFAMLVKKYQDAGVMLLPCLQKAIRLDLKDGKPVGNVGPDNARVREIAQVLLAFPQPIYWELDNEYDVNNRADAQIDWENYALYHKKFGQLVSLIGGDRVTAVEQGRASIRPDQLTQMIERGAFDHIGVTNVHHYCGTEAPEENYGNFNTGFGGRGMPTMLFYDRLREWVRASSIDGKSRQAWLTEFGWDTLAGPVVSNYQQAVYLQRGWMVTLAAGFDKAFWFFDYDVPVPKGFFDGCGLLNAKAEPKLSLCAMAGLSSTLYAPKYVGSINAGGATAGYMFENDGKLVASMWNVPNDDGPAVSFQAESVTDFLGNKIDAKNVKLSMAPVYATGISKDDALYAQTAYSLDTPYLIVAAAGDEVRAVLAVNNNRTKAIHAMVAAALPAGWKAAAAEPKADVESGETRKIELPFTIKVDEELGMKQVVFTVSEAGKVKEIALKVLVQKPVVMQVGAVRGKPGETEVSVRLGNRSVEPLTGELKVHLPSSWKAITPAESITLEPGQDVSKKLQFVWNTDWQSGEEAFVEFDAGGGRMARQNIIPNHFRLHRAKGLKMDGDLGDWPAAAELPAWMLGSTMGAANARVMVAWADEGLYCGVEVKDSKCQVVDPRNFWEGDVMELFVDTADNKEPRTYAAGDHQFWFAPLAKEGKAWVGQWKNGEEVADTRFDLPGIVSGVKKTADGYVMEFLLPAEQLKNYKPAVGGAIGLNANLTVKGQRLDREVYWPWVKDERVRQHPENWGTMELAE